MKQSYSTKELASMWDVSESTVKRWADAGTLKCRKTVGGHRKFELKDVQEFQNHCSLGVKGLSSEKECGELDDELARLLAEPDFAGLSGRFKQAALAGSDGLASSLLNQYHSRGLSLAVIAEEIIRPAMHDIGEMWRVGKIGVLDEHLATLATARAIADLHSKTEKKRGSDRLALVGCSEGELHQLASSLVRDLLESQGWQVVYLGQHAPLFSFAEAVARFKPELVCISITMSDNLERAARDYEGLRRAAARHKAKIVRGGAALKDEEVRARFRGASYAATLHDLLDVINDSVR
jgi:MerR family transcriptional regulator, light-induced transcriptional regulator